MFAPNTKEGAKMDLKNAERSAKQEGRNMANDAEEHITDIANRTGRTMRRYYDAASHELQDDYDMVASRIRSNPLQASVIALGLGVLLGSLFRR